MFDKVPGKMKKLRTSEFSAENLEVEVSFEQPQFFFEIAFFDQPENKTVLNLTTLNHRRRFIVVVVVDVVDVVVVVVVESDVFDAGFESRPLSFFNSGSRPV